MAIQKFRFCFLRNAKPTVKQEAANADDVIGAVASQGTQSQKGMQGVKIRIINSIRIFACKIVCCLESRFPYMLEEE